MTYYNDGNKLTFDEAEQLVVEYMDSSESTKTYATCKDVARFFDVRTSQHNLIRLDDALSRMCEVHRDPDSRPTRYQT